MKGCSRVRSEQQEKKNARSRKKHVHLSYALWLRHPQSTPSSNDLWMWQKEKKIANPHPNRHSPDPPLAAFLPDHQHALAPLRPLTVVAALVHWQLLARVRLQRYIGGLNSAPGVDGRTTQLSFILISYSSVFSWSALSLLLYLSGSQNALLLEIAWR